MITTIKIFISTNIIIIINIIINRIIVILLYKVQVKTEPCFDTGTATCTCGVVIKSGRTGYIVDLCGPRSRRAKFEFKYAPRIVMFECAEDEHDMSIDNSQENLYKVTFHGYTS